MGFNDWVKVDPASFAALDHFDEVDSGAREKLAKDIQTRLRTTIDPGVSLKSAMRAQAVRVTNEGDRLVIDSESQAEVLKAAEGGASGDDPNSVSDVEQLFEMSSGVPSVVNGKLTYRTISPEALFGQKGADQGRVVEQTVTESLRSGITDAYEDAVRNVSTRYSGGK